MKAYQCSLHNGTSFNIYQTGKGKTPLIMLHGWSMSAKAFSEIAASLSSHYRIVLVDLPGHGHSLPIDKPNLAGFSSVLTNWLSSHLTESFVLLGWSLGGMLAMQMAFENKLPLSKLILISSTPKFTIASDWPFGMGYDSVQEMIQNLEQVFDGTLSRFFSLAFAGEKITPQRLRQIKGFALTSQPRPDHETALSLLKLFLNHDQRHQLANIKVPTLVLHGDSDKIIPVAAGKYLSDHLIDAEFVSFKGVGHAPFWSRPAEVVSYLRDFIQ